MSVPRDAVVAESWIPERLEPVLGVLALGFLVTLFSDGAGLHWVESVPRPLHYFAQISGLFPTRALFVIDYRAEGRACGADDFRELDLRPWFPIDRGEKENRFYRALQFYRQNRQVMRALDEYVVVNRNQASLAQAARGQAAEPPLGAVRFSSLRIPFGSPSDPARRYERQSLAAYPESDRKGWYATPRALEQYRCRNQSP